MACMAVKEQSQSSLPCNKLIPTASTSSLPLFGNDAETGRARSYRMILLRPARHILFRVRQNLTVRVLIIFMSRTRLSRRHESLI